MLQNLQKRNKGFTIVEVMIVLAIAGLIILIVFLAVPALQRNARNTQARNAAAAVLATVNEYITNNGGAQPAAATGIIDTAGTITVGTVTGKTQGGYAGNIQTTTTAPTVAGTYNVVLNYKCNSTGTALGVTAPRAIAVLYNVETTSGVALQCTES